MPQRVVGRWPAYDCEQTPWGDPAFNLLFRYERHLKTLLSEKRELNTDLLQQATKIHMEGTMRYWKAALKKPHEKEAQRSTVLKALFA